eukprot:2065650-Pyramimonas_sp.AAC.1
MWEGGPRCHRPEPQAFLARALGVRRRRLRRARQHQGALARGEHDRDRRWGWGLSLEGCFRLVRRGGQVREGVR